MTPAERAELKRVAEADSMCLQQRLIEFIHEWRCAKHRLKGPHCEQSCHIEANALRNVLREFTLDPDKALRLLADVERLERALRDMWGDFHMLHTEPPYSLQARQQCTHLLCAAARAALGGE